MERNPLFNSRLNLLLLAASALSAWLVARASASPAALLAAVFASFGAFVALLGHLQLWLRIREAVEAAELGELAQKRGDTALFDIASDTLRARHVREHFDRFAAPALTLLLWVSLGAIVPWLWRKLAHPAAPHPEKLSLVLSLFSLAALIQFVLGKYAAGIAQHEGQRLLRPASSHLLLAAFISALTVLAAAANWFGLPVVELHLARGLTAMLALVFVETGVNLVLEIYRPRTKGQAAQPLYESRLIGLLSHPEGLFRTAAQTLDYQFGFKVSETWFYRYLEQKLAGLVLLQVLILWFSTTLVIVEPHEQAVLERFGRPVAGRQLLDPGLHWKYPWPIDTARVFATRAVRRFDVGFVPDPLLSAEDTLLWTRNHYREEMNLLVASREMVESHEPGEVEQAVPVNLLTTSIPVQYHITNLLQWTYGHKDGERLLPLIATREITHYLVTVDLEEFMSVGRIRAAKELRDLIQQRVNEAQLGVEVLFVGLQDVHPPVPVADAFEAVNAATQERETRILEAQGYRAERLPKARAEAQQLLQQQRASSVSRVLGAGAQSARFTNQAAAWQASPAVFRTRAYHEALVRAIAPARKFILATTNTHDQFWLNFEEKLRTDLLDVQLPAPKAKP